jgi:hypothetical protein
MGVLNNVPDIPRNITDPIDFIDYVVGVESLFWPVIMLAMAVVIFVNTLIFGASRAAIISTFIAGIMATFVVVIGSMNGGAGWMDPKWLYLFGVLMAGAILWRILESGEQGF